LLQERCLALSGFKTGLLLFSRFLELADFCPNPVNVTCRNFLQQMEIDALEQLISEDVKVQGQIVHDGFKTCLMVFRIVTGVVAKVVTRVIARVITEVVARVVGGADEVYHHSSAKVVGGGVRTHLNACGPLLPSRRGKNLASPWRTSLESANLALAHVYGFLPWPNEEPASSMEH
jgi:hypothetical protein